MAFTRQRGKLGNGLASFCLQQPQIKHLYITPQHINDVITVPVIKKSQLLVCSCF